MGGSQSADSIENLQNAVEQRKAEDPDFLHEMV